MLNNTQNLSPEARDLIDRTIDWLTPKGRWVKGWAQFKTRDGDVIDIDEPEELYDREFRNFTRYNAYDYDYFRPLEDWKGDPTASCLVGSLIINNDYKRDEVFEEAVIFLDNLAVKSGKYEAEEDESCNREAYGRHSVCYCRKCNPYVDPDAAIERLVDLNDSEKYTDKRHVLDLFRRAIRRK